MQASRRSARALRSYGGTAAVEESASFVGELRPYQRDGLRWFAMLRELGLGGCLADDMGLGKTVMVLAWLDRLRAVRRVAAEPDRRAAVGRVQLASRRRAVSRRRCACWISRTRRARPITAACPSAHVVLGTYGTLRRDQAALAAHEFEYVVLDEAQSIKNAATATAKAARALRATPSPRADGHADREPPGGSLERARLRQPRAGGAGRDGPGRVRRAAAGDERDRIARAVRPFILRRTKAQVARDLPPRTEQTITCELGRARAAAVRRAPRSLPGAAAVSAGRGSTPAAGGCRCSRRCCGCARRRVTRG